MCLCGLQGWKDKEQHKKTEAMEMQKLDTTYYKTFLTEVTTMRNDLQDWPLGLPLNKQGASRNISSCKKVDIWLNEIVPALVEVTENCSRLYSQAHASSPCKAQPPTGIVLLD